MKHSATSDHRYPSPSPTPPQELAVPTGPKKGKISREVNPGCTDSRAALPSSLQKIANLGGNPQKALILGSRTRRGSPRGEEQEPMPAGDKGSSLPRRGGFSHGFKPRAAAFSRLRAKARGAFAPVVSEPGVSDPQPQPRRLPPLPGVGVTIHRSGALPLRRTPVPTLPPLSSEARPPTDEPPAPKPLQPTQQGTLLVLRQMKGWCADLSPEESGDAETTNAVPGSASDDSTSRQDELAWDQILLDCKDLFSSSAYKLPDVPLATRLSKAKAAYDAATPLREMGTIAINWLFHYAVKEAPTLQAASQLRFPPPDSEACQRLTPALLMHSDLAEEVPSMLKTLLEEAPQACKNAGYWSLYSQSGLGSYDFIDALRAHRCPLCGEITSDDSYPRPHAVNMVHILTPFLLSAPEHHPMAETATPPPYTRTTFMGREVNIKGGLLLPWLFYVRLLAAPIIAHPKYCDFSEFGLASGACRTAKTPLDCVVAIATAFVSMVKTDLLRHAPTFYPSLDSMLAPPGVASVVDIGHRLNKAHTLRQVQTLQECLTTAEIALCDRIQQKLSISEASTTPVLPAAAHARLAELIDFCSTEEEDVERVLKDVTNLDIPQKVSAKRRAIFEAKRLKYIRSLEAVRQRLRDAREELDSASKLLYIAAETKALPYKYSPERINALTPELQNMAYISAALASKSSALHQLLDEGANWANLPEDWSDQAVVTAARRPAAGRSIQARLVEGVVHPSPPEPPIRIPPDPGISPDDLARLPEAARHDRVARAAYLVDLWKDQPYRIRGLIAAAWHNAPFLSALQSAVKHTLDGRAGSLLRMIACVRRALLRDMGALSDTAMDLAARRQAILSLSERKNSNLLLGGDITPEAVRAYSGGAVSRAYCATLSAILDQSPARFEVSMREWNKLMHAINGNINLRHKVNWTPNTMAKVAVGSTNNILSRRRMLAPEGSLAQRKRATPNNHVVAGEDRVDMLGACDDRTFTLAPALAASATVSRDFFSADAASAGWSRLARSTIERVAILALIPTFESGLQRCGSGANYALLRLAVLAQHDTTPLNLYQRGNLPRVPYTRQLAITSLSFSYRVISLSVTSYVQAVVAGGVTVGALRHVFGPLTLAYVAGGAVDAIRNSKERRLLQAVFNAYLVDITASYPDSPTAHAVDILPRIHYTVAGPEGRMQFILLRVELDRAGDPQLEDHLYVGGDLPVSELLNTQAPRILSTSADVTSTPVTNQANLLGLVATNTGVTTSGGVMGIINYDAPDNMPKWDFVPDCGHYLNALVTMGVLQKNDDPSQTNPGFERPVEHLSVTGFTNLLRESIAKLREVWDSYQTALADQDGDQVLTGSEADITALKVVTKAGFISSIFATPGVSYLLFAHARPDHFDDCTDLTRVTLVTRWGGGDPMESTPPIFPINLKFTTFLGPQATAAVGDFDNLKLALKANSIDAAITDLLYEFYSENGVPIPRVDAFAASSMAVLIRDRQEDGPERLVFVYRNNIQQGQLAILYKNNPLRAPLESHGALARIFFEPVGLVPGEFPVGGALVALTPELLAGIPVFREEKTGALVRDRPSQAAPVVAPAVDAPPAPQGQEAAPNQEAPAPGPAGPPALPPAEAPHQPQEGGADL
ncbi:hypothetical protein [Schistocephalus solidus toti-like virus 3]|nr:hypothetical protein [Schistocephalus solidus toti-like virus 3]